MSRSANIQEVSELLDAERAALLQGDFKALEHLITRKEKFRKALERHPPSFGVMEMLQKRFEHNQMLLAAASDGIAVARAALDMLSVGQVNVTYGPAGQRESLHVPAQHLSRKF